MSTHCYKCNHNYKDGAISICPHEAVQKRYGETICVHCCLGCKHVVRTPMTSMIKCGYTKEESK